MLRITRFSSNQQGNPDNSFTCFRSNHMQSVLQPVKFMTMMMISTMTHLHMHMKQTQKMRKQNVLDTMMDQQHIYSHACIVYMSHNQLALMDHKFQQMKQRFLWSHDMSQTATHPYLKNKDMKEFSKNQTYTDGFLVI